MEGMQSTPCGHRNCIAHCCVGGAQYAAGGQIINTPCLCEEMRMSSKSHIMILAEKLMSEAGSGLPAAV